jgi:hypothetical protein
MKLMPESWQRNPLVKYLGYVLLLMSGPAGILLAFFCEREERRSQAPP